MPEMYIPYNETMLAIDRYYKTLMHMAKSSGVQHHKTLLFECMNQLHKVYDEILAQEIVFVDK